MAVVDAKCHQNGNLRKRPNISNNGQLRTGAITVDEESKGDVPPTITQIMTALMKKNPIWYDNISLSSKIITLAVSVFLYLYEA